MPRPGPRPFECVRRAWHSDRHQPIRGSLIQEIFRVVNEIHSSATRSNREWQEKLPIVVLKAEEIMYSKANSEVEYSDLTTVWDRTNDAINTIIRLDESTETGEHLRPCIEAALVLGSIPRRPSRSQRNYNPKCYLTPSTPESAYAQIQTNHITNSQFMDANSKPQKHVLTANHFPSWSQNIPRCLPKETNKSNSCSMYPLYYGTPLLSQQSQLNNCPIAPMKNSEIPELSTTRFLENLTLCDLDVSKEIPQPQLRRTRENPPGVQCDLSLRLGPLSSRPSTSIKTSCPREVEEFGSSGICQAKSISSDLTPPVDTEFSFFPIREDHDLVGSCPGKWSSEVGYNADINSRKRKTPYSSPSEDRHAFWQPKLPCNQLYGKSRNAGL